VRTTDQTPSPAGTATPGPAGTATPSTASPSASTLVGSHAGTLVGTSASTADEVVGIVAAIRRISRRRLRGTVPGPMLRGTQLELLRLVETEPGIGVAAAARAAEIARDADTEGAFDDQKWEATRADPKKYVHNTVDVLKELMRLGWIQRHILPSGPSSAYLHSDVTFEMTPVGETLCSSCFSACHCPTLHLSNQWKSYRRDHWPAVDSRLCLHQSFEYSKQSQPSGCRPF